jgi:FkbH-like protein
MTSATSTLEAPSTETGKPRVIKVLVWDLDNTLWDGTLLEGDDVKPRPGVVELLEALDQRGILQSVASKNDHEAAWGKLRELGLDHYFIYPQIHWGSKAESMKKIAESINIGLDAVAFVDDQEFERDEVSHAVPEVLTYDAADVAALVDREELIPRFITDESSIRRQMYQADIARNQVEESFEGPSEEFLSSLDMKFTLGPCREEDLKRAEELTVRTNQLNTTGRTYNYEELDALRKSDDHLLLVASLVDKYGTYGKIGLALVEKGEDENGPVWRLLLQLMSCRVMSRGVGTILLNHLLTQARDAGARFLAEYKSNGRNRMMLVTFTFAGFEEIEVREDGMKVLEHKRDLIQPPPEYVDVVVTG